VSLGVSEETLPDEGFAEEKLNILLIPASSRQSLQEHHNLLEVHLEQLVGPFDQESSADIKMEVGESLVLGLLTVSLDTTLYWEHQHTKYVSHILMVFLTLISRMSKQFIHRKLNCMNSTPSFSRCFAKLPSMRVVRSRRLATCR
jgi:hypothetical protein